MRRLATANAIFSALIVAFADSIGNDNTDNPSDHPFPLYSLSSLSFLFVYDKIDSFFFRSSGSYSCQCSRNKYKKPDAAV